MESELQELRPPFRELIEKKNLVGIEIGVGSGRNALSILSNLDIKKLYLIDSYKRYKLLGKGVPINVEEKLRDAKENLSKFDDKVEWIIAFSEDAVDYIVEPLDFVYIDANHRYEYVKKDIELYYPLVKSDGIISGHDYKKRELGVIKAVNEFFGKENINVENENWWIFA